MTNLVQEWINGSFYDIAVPAGEKEGAGLCPTPGEVLMKKLCSCFNKASQ